MQASKRARRNDAAATTTTSPPQTPPPPTAWSEERERDVADAWTQYKDSWRRMLERDPRPPRALAPDEATHARWLHAWYARQLWTHAELQYECVEMHRARHDWFYMLVYLRSRAAIVASNGHVRSMMTGYRHWLVSHVFVVAKSTSVETRETLANVDALFALAESEMAHFEAAFVAADAAAITFEQHVATCARRDRPRQIMKHFVLYMCMATFSGIVNWMCDKMPVLDARALRAWVRTFVVQQAHKLMMGVDNVVMRRFVYDCRVSYVSDVGLAYATSGPSHNENVPLHEFLLEEAQRDDIRHFVDSFLLSKRTLVDADAAEAASRDRAQAEWERRTTLLDEHTRDAHTTHDEAMSAPSNELDDMFADDAF